MALNKEQLNALRLKLEGTLRDINEELKGSDEKVTDQGDDVDNLDEETDEAEEFSTNVAIAAGLKERRASIESALERMTAGTYGKCAKCGEDISVDVLNADPESLLCKDCKAPKK